MFSDIFGDLINAGRRRDKADEFPAHAKAIIDFVNEFFQWLLSVQPAGRRLAGFDALVEGVENECGQAHRAFLEHPDQRDQLWSEHLARKAEFAAMKQRWELWDAERRKEAKRRVTESRKQRSAAKQAEAEAAARKQREEAAAEAERKQRQEAQAREDEARRQEEERKQRRAAIPLRTVWRKCYSPGCHCMNGGKLHGPYQYRYGKSRRVGGKVVTEYGGKE